MIAERIRTNIPLLDEMLGGGLPARSCTALWSEVEVDATSLALQIMYNRVCQSDRAVFLSMTKKTRQVMQMLDELALPLEPSEITFIDVDSLANNVESHHHDDGRVMTVSERKGEGIKSTLIDKIRGALGKSGGATNSRTFLVIDSFSAIIDRLEDPMDSLEILNATSEILSRSETTALFVFTEWDYGEELVAKLRSAFQAIVDLRATPEKPIYSMNVSVAGASQVSSSDRLAFFKVQRPGGVKIYLPKIIVTGPFHAGKSSFIHSASNGAVSADRLGTTVALDYGHVSHRGFFIDLFGTPGQTRFDRLLERLGENSVGIILLVSAADVRGLSRVREQMRLVRSEGLPHVVAVNKVNLRGAISLAAVRNLLKIPRRIPVIPMQARDLSEVRPEVPCRLNPSDVQNVLDGIVNEILKFERGRAC